MAGPMTPTQAVRTAKAIADIYGEAQAKLTALLARAVAAGTSQSSRAAVAAKLAEIQQLHSWAEQVVAQAQAAAGQEAVHVVERAYAAGLRGLDTNQPAVAAIGRSLLFQLDQAGPMMLRWVDDAYRQVIAETAPLASAGVVTVDQAAAAAVDRFATMGVTAFVDKGGQAWRIDTYAEMATRTAVIRSYVEGTKDRIAGRGDDLVQVSVSGGSCPACAPYEGQVFSLNGVTPGYPMLSDAAGLWHPNCTHSISGYTPGLSQPLVITEAQRQEYADAYAARQRTRVLQRRVAESVRRVTAARQMRDPELLSRMRALEASRRSMLREHLDRYGRAAA